MQNDTRIIRAEPRASAGWNGGDIDTALTLMREGMVWDGRLPSKSSRSHFVEHGYAVRADGYQALTGRGVLAMLHPRYWAIWFCVWRRLGHNPFVSAKTCPDVRP